MGLDRPFNFRTGISVGIDNQQIADGQGNLSAVDLTVDGVTVVRAITADQVYTTSQSGLLVTPVLSAADTIITKGLTANNFVLNTSTSGQIISGGLPLHEIFAPVDIPTAYTTVYANSANWGSAYTTLVANSANWQDTYTTVSANSAVWNLADVSYTTLTANSASWSQGGSISSVVTANSAGWDLGSTSYSVITANSGAWLAGGGSSGTSTQLTGTDIIAPIAITPITTANYGSGTNISWTRNLFTYTLQFTTPQPDANYVVLTDNEGRDDVFMQVTNKTVSSFTINSFDDNGPLLRPEPTLVVIYGSTPTVGISGTELGISAWTTIQANSASWLSGGSGQSPGGNTGGDGSGAAGIFITNITCGSNSSGITLKTLDTDEIAIDSIQPVVSAVVDDSDVRFYAQWEGSSTEWTGSPSISGITIPRGNTTAIAGDHARRFEGYVDLDLSEHAGTTTQIPYTYEGSTRHVGVQIAGAGPVITNFAITSTPQHSQDHYKDGDNITFVIEFDTADVSTISLDGGNNYATGTVNNLNVTMNGLSATVTTPVDTSLTSKQDRPVRVTAKNSFGTEGAPYTSTETAQVMNGPVITGVTYGTYPTTFGVQQTELKDNDQVSATFTFDTTNVNRIALQGGGNNAYANTSQTVTVNTTGTTSATTTITVDTTLANNTGGFARPVLARAYKNGQHGSSNNFTSSNTLQVNNQAPTFSTGSITYPTGQSALKDAESATVNVVVNNQGGVNAQYTYSSPNNQLSINNTGSYAANKTATRSSGNYNINTANYRLVVNRVENGRSSTKNITVFIAHVAPTINIVTNNGTRMRSGGNDNTSQQNYNVVMSSTQRLKQAPTLTAPEGTLGNFNYNAGSTTFTATMGVHDNNDKGSFTYTGLNAVNLANRAQNTINSGGSYVFGGFVSRTVTLEAFLSETDINVLWVTYNKLTISWSKNSDVNIRVAAGTTSQTTNSWCILDQTNSNTGTAGGPITVKILDFSKTNAVSEDSTITIQETV